MNEFFGYIYFTATTDGWRREREREREEREWNRRYIVIGLFSIVLIV